MEALLATLALSCGRLVSIDALARRVWGEDPPERIRGSLRTNVMRLRRLFGEHVVVTERKLLAEAISLWEGRNSSPN
ncbi:winged helix-turn-helix domain-containing protein [Amycolatopsis sp. NPDC051071]|uniref:AfsR/SARP family transcriptional regulator n=1 Tax=Amycolatopsis sp. NPDC051071 TaxID=3154637 RepID=UPI00343C1ECF